MKEWTGQAHSLLTDCHFFNLRRAMLTVTALYDRHMKDTNITAQQFSILRHIHNGGPLSVTELSDRIGVERTTMSRNIVLLERRGYMSEQPSCGRQRQMVLTADGERIYEQALFGWKNAQKELEERLGPGRMELLEELLNELLAAE